MNLFIGSNSTPSIIGLKDCGFWYWALQGIFIVECCIFTYIAIQINRKEQVLRRKYNVNYYENEFSYEGKNVIKLVVIGFVGGWVAGAMGLGGGSIYNPAFLSLGVHPRVAGATGMCLVLFSTINSVVVYVINNYL